MSVDRYRIEAGFSGHIEDVLDKDGPWVLYADFEKVSRMLERCELMHTAAQNEVIRLNGLLRLANHEISEYKNTQRLNALLHQTA